jgi:hypothetical protein
MIPVMSDFVDVSLGKPGVRKLSDGAVALFCNRLQRDEKALEI